MQHLTIRQELRLGILQWRPSGNGVGILRRGKRDALHFTPICARLLTTCRCLVCYHRWRLSLRCMCDYRQSSADSPFFFYTSLTFHLVYRSSIQPIAGAQYHWTWQLAPPRHRRFITWIQGWITWFSWVSLLCSVVNTAANITTASVSYTHLTLPTKRIV